MTTESHLLRLPKPRLLLNPKHKPRPLLSEPFPEPLPEEPPTEDEEETLPEVDDPKASQETLDPLALKAFRKDSNTPLDLTESEFLLPRSPTRVPTHTPRVHERTDLSRTLPPADTRLEAVDKARAEPPTVVVNDDSLSEEAEPFPTLKRGSSLDGELMMERPSSTPNSKARRMLRTRTTLLKPLLLKVPMVDGALPRVRLL